LPFLDLRVSPPEPSLVTAFTPREMIAGRWLPHRRIGNRIVVASSEPPDENVITLIRRMYGDVDVEFAVTTDWDIDQSILSICRETILHDAALGFAEDHPQASAMTGNSFWQTYGFIALVIAVVAASALRPITALTTLLLVVNLLFFLGITFKLVTVAFGARHLGRIHEQRVRLQLDGIRAAAEIPTDQLPRYTILVPAYQEAKVVGMLLDNIGRLDYPAAKLEVLLLLEEGDDETIEAAKASQPPDFVRFIVVPAGDPKTKPKACNVGLNFATGDFLVIYDAEDRPDPDQLRQAVAAFAEAPPEVVCVQARLNYFNAEWNLLTRLFTLEYSYWFDYMLPGLDALRLPIPLGGTSNHFRTDLLRQLGAWDPWNVTEDADLGIRATALGYRIEVIDSTTWEEACSEWKAWVRQRTRWIKGYMVTTLVHSRHPYRFLRSCGLRGTLGLVGLIAGTPLTFLACPLVWALGAYSYLGGHIAGVHFAPWVVEVTTANLLIGNGSMVVLGATAVLRRRAWRLAPYALLNPLFWFLHSIAAWRALYQLVRSPFNWEKTPHGMEQELNDLN
jgi:cellulose synthase/poly-beta-1,6-N-acetylglucosamine synthase-like glycosyltransferase